MAPACFCSVSIVFAISLCNRKHTTPQFRSVGFVTGEHQKHRFSGKKAGLSSNKGNHYAYGFVYRNIICRSRQIDDRYR
jgi:hypothetical protein